MMKIWLFICFVGVAFGRPGNNRFNNAIWIGNGRGGGNTKLNSQGGDNMAVSSQTFEKSGSSCGQSTFAAASAKRSISPFIVGGQNAARGQFPWQVSITGTASLFHTNKWATSCENVSSGIFDQVGIIEKGYLICGGSYVLGSNGGVRVITAAHCVEGRRRHYSVVFGLHDTRDNSGSRVVPISNLIRHRNYDSVTMANDIAILEVTITQNDLADTFATPICLASRDYANGEVAEVSGWGTLSEGGSSPNTLRYVEKTILSYNYCNTQTGNAGELDSSMMCAGEAGKDACQGDSGGPLAANRNGIYELVGVVSWGYGCGRDNFPGVYADVWALKSWIEANY